jgi:dCTP deaminase
MNLSDRTLKQMMPTLFPHDKGANASIDFEKQIQPSTIDLRLGNVFWRSNSAPFSPDPRIVDPRVSDPTEFFKRIEVGDGDYMIMDPFKGVMMAQTMEYVCVPNNMVGFVDGRSSYGRWGLRIHSTAGLIDAGFQGIITLEIALDSQTLMKLWPGDRICQIRFEQLDAECERPYGPARRSKYHGQQTAELSRSSEDSNV